MARNKFPEETEKKIIEVATKHFLEKGWDETRIQDIVDELGGLTKGAFYHHFKTKNELIEKVTSKIFNESSPLHELKNIKHLNGLEQIKFLFIRSFTDKLKIKFLKQAKYFITDPKVITQQIYEIINLVSPTINNLIELGIQDGSIKVKYPKQAAETLLLLGNLWINPDIFVISKEEFLNKIYHLKDIYDSIGLPVFDEEVLIEFKTFATEMFDN